jgi:Tol biopolymer transport system component
MVFGSLNVTMNVWGLNANTDQGTASGEPQQLTQGQTAKWAPFSSRDGSKLAFVSFEGMRASRMEIRVKDLAGNRETTFPAKEGPALGSFGMPVLSADGSVLAYRDRVSEGNGSYVLSLGGGFASSREICADCLVRDFFLDRDSALVQYMPSLIVRQNLVTGNRTTVLDIGANRLRSASLSHDDRWLAIAVGKPDGKAAIYAAPVRDEPAREKEWALVCEDDHYLDSPKWSPNGKLLYYLSERSGECGIWTQRFDPAARKPLGTAFAVFRPNSARRGMNLPAGNGALGVAPGRLIFYMAEGLGNIYMAMPKPR